MNLKRIIYMAEFILGSLLGIIVGVILNKKAIVKSCIEKGGFTDNNTLIKVVEIRRTDDQKEPTLN
tara:strand:+ start:2135 stop:2332 length:198 start_codon:yes stop_codon:yes gene_type:complete